jgi:hypothetical protein
MEEFDRFKKKIDAFPEKLLKMKEVAIGCNDNIMGKDWFLIKLSKSFPFYQYEEFDAEVVHRYVSIIRNLIKEGKLERVVINQYGAIYQLTGKNFKNAYFEYKNKYKK